MTHVITQCSTPPPRLSNTPVVSIIDDDQDVRGGVETLIQALGYDTVTFACGEDYLLSGLARITSCLISDVQMPGISGPDLQDRLIADGHQIPIIFVTALRD